MPSILIPKNHPFLLVGQEIDQILTPLKRYGIRTLTFIRNYDTGHQILLSNNSNWVEDYYHENLPGNFLSGHPKQYTQKYLIIPNESSLPVHKISRERYNEGNTFCLIHRYEKFTEFFFFAGHVNNISLPNFFINNVDLFQTFTTYFKSAAEDLITRGDEFRILLPTAHHTALLPDIAKLNYDADSILDILKEMKIKHFKFSDNTFKLTEREIDCIAAYQQELTAKEIAKMLNLSFRTVEKYFDAINKKLDMFNKKDSIKFLIEHGFPEKVLTYSTYNRAIIKKSD